MQFIFSVLFLGSTQFNSVYVHVILSLVQKLLTSCKTSFNKSN